MNKLGKLVHLIFQVTYWETAHCEFEFYDGAGVTFCTVISCNGITNCKTFCHQKMASIAHCFKSIFFWSLRTHIFHAGGVKKKQSCCVHILN